MTEINFQPLDIAACFGTGFTAKAISYGTASFLAPPRLKIGPSHVAVLCEFHGSMVWIESTTLCKHPCAILGYQVDGCQAAGCEHIDLLEKIPAVNGKNIGAGVTGFFLNGIQHRRIIVKPSVFILQKTGKPGR